VSALGRVVIGGVGLIGGSFALALKSAHAVLEVVGVGRSVAALEEAKSLGVIDRIASHWADAAADADVILLSMPVGALPQVFSDLAPHVHGDTLLMDAGSTKADVVLAAIHALGDKLPQFVPAHPIAGAEKSGVRAAQADLYHNRRVVLTPTAETDPQCLARARQIWALCQAHISVMSADVHDAVFAAVSHLPHVLAFALVDELSRRDNADQLFSFAASGFRDFTRIASSHPEMWRDICVANRAAIGRELDAYLAALLRMRALLAGADAQSLETLFDCARHTRNRWLASL
jgi:prephenate dehydrogenase